ncbi:zinc finger protein 862-like [Odontesthes bonariensis]|uniref:zinc finger protein 862-like n=1 Tax=Odontesthes bonariensis TaxID=219752 RepID=UPI003F58ED18
MEVAIERTLIEQLDEKLKQSEFLGLIIDETVNITVNKKLIVYLKFENRGKAETVFLGNYTIQSGMARSIYSNVVDALKERGLDIRRVIGLGSDGASVMMGCHSGVGALLKQESAFAVQVHCIAHRVALAASDASKAVQMVAHYKRTVNSVYSFYKHSATRTNRLRELSATLTDEDMTSLKQQCAVRWLSLGKAVSAVKKNWPALIMELSEEAANGNAQSQGLLNQIRSYKFIALTHTLSDVLPVMDKLNLCFQREDVNLGCISPMVQASLAALAQLKDTPGPEEQGFHCAFVDCKFKDLTVTESTEKHVRTFDNRRRQYIEELIESLERRFPRDDVDILKGFDLVFNPDRYPVSCEMQQYAQHAVKPLIEHYETPKETETGAVEPLISPENAQRDVVPLMTALRGYGGLNFLTACETVVRELGDIFPEWAKLAKIACTIPVSSVPAERGFSLQNRIKTSIRNRISEEKVTRLMRISCSGPGLKDFDFPRAAENFHAMKLRRK